MSLAAKSLCGMKRSTIREHFKEVQKIVSCPKFVCGKCARVASQSCFLCKARRLGKD